MENAALQSLLRQNSTLKKPKTSNTCKTFFKMFKLFPLLSSGCKMVALLGRTFFGYRNGRVMLAIQDDPKCFPNFVIELPLLTNALHKEMTSGLVRIALESETRTSKRKLLEEYVWAVYCNGKKTGYSIRRKQTYDDELHVMQLLRGVSMGAGVLPAAPNEKETLIDGELPYLRARFERVVGSKDSEAFYMINPDGTSGPDLCIFFIRQ
ncbi:hypothetical protein MKX01_034319 [Papaver californicum]|nr:hypothetical protein MKX01_034319 [Papaver californicum]